MEKSKFYVTTAIPYVNAAPHIGFALEIIQADVLARYHRLIGDETYFLTGTDENALKNVQAAEEAGEDVKTFVEQNSQSYENLKDALNISFDDFIRTTEDRHVKGAQKFWKACNPNDIYKKKYSGLYCVGCEEFKKGGDLVDGKCPEHNTPCEEVEEENYFFRLSRYQNKLEELIESDEVKITPNSRKNETLSFIRQGLEDFSISRSKERAHEWGISVPGDDSQVMYVWFDALTNYITALGYAKDGNLYKKFWVDNPNRVHVIGKGILRFHTVYWPAMLLSANLPLPTEIFTHGYLTAEGQKISKSLDNAIDPYELVKKYGADPVRYYLLSRFSPYHDGDFSETKLKEAYNGDLAHGLGNLVSRVSKLCATSEFKLENEYTPKLNPFVTERLDDYHFELALAHMWREVKWGVRWLNQRINKRRVWELDDKKLLNLELHLYVTHLLSIAYNLEPFLPETAEKIKKQFSGKITHAQPLFPHLG